MVLGSATGNASGSGMVPNGFREFWVWFYVVLKATLDGLKKLFTVARPT